MLRTSDAREQRVALAPWRPRISTPSRDGRAMRARRRCAHLDHAGRDRGRDPVRADRAHASYDAAAAKLFWRQLVQADRVFNIFRARFLGKSSPSHFFWGGFDLAVTRFSGRAAPPLKRNAPNVALWVMNEAYSHECRASASGPAMAATAARRFTPTRIRSRKVSRRRRIAGAAYTARSGNSSCRLRRGAQPASPDEALLNFMQAPMRPRRTTANGIAPRWSALVPGRTSTARKITRSSGAIRNYCLSQSAPLFVGRHDHFSRPSYPHLPR